MNITIPREQYLDQIEKIMALPQTQKWRATRDFLRAINPSVRKVDDEFILELNNTRNDQLNEFGANKDMNIRQLMDMPEFLYEALITVDNQLLTAVTGKDKQEEKRAWRKLAEVFPEYRIASKI
jgi:hypothetical protein